MAPLLLVESTGRHIDVLRLNLQFPALPILCPLHCSLKQSTPDSFSPMLRMNPKIPRQLPVITSLEFVDTIGIMRQNTTGYPPPIHMSGQQPPVDNVPSLGPMYRKK